MARSAGLLLGVGAWLAIAAARGMAAGTLLMGGVLLLLALAVSPPPMPSAGMVTNLLALGLVCGAVAYILYFRLIADIGPTGALTVTYLIPVFGVLWGALFLGEALSLHVIAGALVVIAGTVLVLRS